MKLENKVRGERLSKSEISSVMCQKDYSSGKARPMPMGGRMKSTDPTGAFRERGKSRR